MIKLICRPVIRTNCRVADERVGLFAGHTQLELDPINRDRSRDSLATPLFFKCHKSVDTHRSEVECVQKTGQWRLDVEQEELGHGE